MATEESYAPRHGRHSAQGRHSAPRVEESVETTEAPKRRGKRFSTPAPAEVEPTPESIPVPVESEPIPVPVEPEPVPTPVEPEPVLTPIEPEPAFTAPEPLPVDVPLATVPIVDGDQETAMSDAPRPIGVDPEETGSFKRIGASEGARLTTRANASDTASFMAQAVRPVEAVRMSSAGRPKVEHREVEMQSNKRVFLVLGIGALAVMALVIVLLTRAFNSVEETTAPPVYEQVQSTGEDGIEYRGATYSISEQAAGKYALVSTSEGFEGTAVLYELPGTPVTLILYDTVFVIPENLDNDTWDLIAHPLGGGSVTQQVTDADGNPIVGEGQIKEATLSGDVILITTESDEQFSVSLV